MSREMVEADGALPHTGASHVFDALGRLRLVVVSGKGGVGRTTLAGLLGLALAKRGKKVLVATTGLDDRLAWMLGAQRLTDRPSQVGPGLWVQRLVPQVCIREYGGLILRSAAASAAVFDNTIVKRLLRAIPGLDDFAVVGKAWHEAIRGTDYDQVIFDGPATGHLLFVLGVPKAVLEAIPYGPLRKEAALMQESFQDPSRVQALLVGIPERWPLTELGELASALRDEIEMQIAAIVVNGTWPEAAGLPADLSGFPAEKDFLAVVRRISDAGCRQRLDIAQWRERTHVDQPDRASWLSVPWQWTGLSSRADAEALLHQLDAQTDAD